MRLGKYLYGLTRSELEHLKAELNLSDEDNLIFDDLAKGKSNGYVADVRGLAYSTLSKRILAIQKKIKRVR